MLDAQHERFCREYVIDYNATQAAARAGYSERSAHTQGCRLMDRIDIQLCIEVLKLEINTKLAVTRERVIEEFGRIAFADRRKMILNRAGFSDLNGLDDDTAACIEGFKFKQGQLVEIKTSSKEKALANLGKHFNIYEDHQKSGTGEVHVHIEGKDALL